MKKGKGKNGSLLPNSLRIISSCLKTVSTNASNVASTVRSAGASVAASISTASEDHKDQVTWAGFDRLEVSATEFKRVLLLGYHNGFQVFDVDDACNFSELVSKRDGPVSFLQMQPCPHSSVDGEGFRSSHPMLLVVAGDNNKISSSEQYPGHLGGTAQDICTEPQSGNSVNAPTTVLFYSLQSHGYVHVLRFRTSVCFIRCSAQIVAVGLATQIYCFDALTLQNKFSVLTYPVPQMMRQGGAGVNVGYGPMDVGPRWLAYASDSPWSSNMSRTVSQNLNPSPGVSPSTSPSGSNLVAPISPISAWKTGRMAGIDLDNAGLVVVKDFVSRAIISQFQAHSSPLCALCFDPSGTLLVTASIYGNNINVFRIMPCRKHSATGVQSYDWSSSHVHLYKLHRGMTSAVIQDICFSHSSHWVAIVSAKGTCHIFVLSPFGGDIGFQTLTSESEELPLCPVSSCPWWFSSSFVVDAHLLPPPPPVGLSVVSRIKYSSFGWLSTVSNAAASATGKVFVPSGAVAAVFHNSMEKSLAHVNMRSKPLEHLLVYTPSGHVVQHELLPSIGSDIADSGVQKRTTSFLHVQDNDLRVKVEPIQWWDVCRRLVDWPDRQETIAKAFISSPESADKSQCKLGFEDGMQYLKLNESEQRTPNNGSVQINERQRLNGCLSNAELQVNSGRSPLWQKTEISFHLMGSQKASTLNGGEFEIEEVHTHEVEIRQKESLPVYHFHNVIKSGLNDRFFSVSKPPLPPLEHYQGESKVAQEIIICHSKPASLSSTESSEAGSSRRLENVLDLDQMNGEKHHILSCHNLDETWQADSKSAVGTALAPKSVSAGFSAVSHSDRLKAGDKNSSTYAVASFFEGKVSRQLKFIAQRIESNHDVGSNDVSAACEHHDSDLNVLVDSSMLPKAQDLVDCGSGLREQSKSNGLFEVANAVENNNGKQPEEKPVEDVENGDMVDAMFPVPEDG